MNESPMSKAVESRDNRISHTVKNNKNTRGLYSSNEVPTNVVSGGNYNLEYMLALIG